MEETTAEIPTVKDGAVSDVQSEQLDLINTGERDCDVSAEASDEDDISEEKQEQSGGRRGEDRGNADSYRIVVQNLPKYFGYKELKKFFGKIGLNPTKIKPVTNKGRGGKQSACYLNFRTKEEMPEAIRKICTSPYHGTVLTAKEAEAVPDPFTWKQQRKGKFRQNAPTAEENKRPPEEVILDIVTNLHHLKNYEDQLITKQNHASDILRKIHKQFQFKAQGTLPWLKDAGGHLCEIDKIRPSPQPTKYRNKCEFTIGFSVDSKRTIGFKLGKYREGVIVVASPMLCTHISDQMKCVVNVFERYIQESAYPPLDEQTREGNWHMLTVRTNSAGQSMAIVHFHPQKLTNQEIQHEKDRLKAYFGTVDSTEIPAFVFWVNDDRTAGQKRAESLGEELLHGDPNAEFTETLLGYNFEISPDSFFQVNNSAAEVLYSTLLEVAEVTPNTVVLDLCCGTGTIGIIMAKHVKQVVGVEIGEASVIDARENAARNGISNIDFICAKVEDVMESVISKYVKPEDDVVVVLDPPRCGVPNSVIDSLRLCSRIRRLLFVACAADNEFTMGNLYGLCKKKAKNTAAGEVSYIPLRCIPVDLFPQTKNVELVFVFDRSDRPTRKSLMDIAMST